MSRLAVKSIAVTALLLATGAVFAQNGVGANAANVAAQNVLQLSASGSVEVQQDLLVIRLAATKDGSDAASVQTQLKQIMDSALASAKKEAKPQQMEVRSGDFTLYPRSNRDGKITGWQGRAELILEGRDFSRITTTAGAIQNMTISTVAFDLSREAREKVESEAQAKAITAFKARASEISKSFGFGGYTLREVAVNDNGTHFSPMPRTANYAASSMKMASDSPVPVEAGKSRVEVSVSGSVQMR